MEQQDLFAIAGKHNRSVVVPKQSHHGPSRNPVKLPSLLIALLMTAAGTPATPAAETVAANANIRFSQSKTPGAELQLEAKQAALADIVNQVAAKTNVVIHYSVLPEAPVSATCIAGKVQQLMECLVGKQIGVMAHKGDSGKEEVWLLGSSVGGCPATKTVANATPAEIAPVPLTPEQEAEMERSAREQTQSMLQQAKSKDPSQRQAAINNLAAPSDDPSVEQALRDALHDKDSNVRAQSVYSLALRGQQDALNQALSDRDPNVRMAVISVSGFDSGLLQQALQDSNADVRNMAQSRIAELERQLAKQAQ